MDEIKLGNFITLADERRYCIVNQKKIGQDHFASALTVPNENEGIEEIKNAELVLLKSVFLENGKIGTREYLDTEEDYLKIMDILRMPND